jgi:hypothetical protein
MRGRFDFLAIRRKGQLFSQPVHRTIHNIGQGRQESSLKGNSGSDKEVSRKRNRKPEANCFSGIGAHGSVALTQIMC